MIQWAAYDPGTGVCIEELPGLRITSSVSQIIGRGDQVAASLPVTDRLPSRWDLATTPGRVVIAGVIDPGGSRPSDASVLWGGWVARRSYGSGAEIDLQLQPPEAWLGRNYVPTVTWTQTPDTTIMRGLGLDAVAVAFHGTVTETVSPTLRDRAYTADQDKTRLSAMQDLMRVIDGPEFALGWRIDDAGALCLTARTAAKLGRRATPDFPPSVLISRAEWTATEDYGDGKGATIYTGVATRSGEGRVTVSLPNEPLLAAGYLALERRWQPDTGAADAPSIYAYVFAAIRAQSLGTRTYGISVHLDDALPGRDFALGDDVAVDLTNPDLPGVDVSTTMRLIGWVASPDPTSGEITQISPVLYDEEV